MTSWPFDQFLLVLISWPVGQEFDISILWIIELFVADQSEESEVKQNLKLTTSAGVKCRSTCVDEKLQSKIEMIVKEDEQGD